MNTRQVIFIDGVKTREAIDLLVGKREGITRLCIEKGVSNGAINRICRNGYGIPETIKKYRDAGFPIITSTVPVPCRKRKKHTRRDADPNNKPKSITLTLPSIEEQLRTAPTPKQLSFEDITAAAEIKELLISHLTALIEDLKKL